MVTIKVKKQGDLEVGDKVLITNNKSGSRNAPGDIGTVGEISKGLVAIDVEGKPDKPGTYGNWTLFEDIEKIINDAEDGILDITGDLEEIAHNTRNWTDNEVRELSTSVREWVDDIEEEVEETTREVLTFWGKIKAKWEAFKDLFRS